MAVARLFGGSRKHGTLVGAMIVFSVLVALAGYHAMQGVSELKQRNFRYLAIAYQLSVEIDRNRPAEAQAKVFRELLDSARKEPEWCLSGLNRAERIILSQLRGDGPLPVCEKGLADIDSALAAVDNFDAGGSSFLAMRSRVALAVRQMVRTSLAIEPHAKSAKLIVNRTVFFVTLLTGGIIFMLTRRVVRRLDSAVWDSVEAANQAQRSRSRLAAAIETTSDGFAIFDPVKGLVLSNSAFRVSVSSDPEAIVSGCAPQDLLMGGLETGLFAVEEGKDHKDWVAEAWSKVFEDGETLGIETTDDRHISLTAFRTEQGDIVVSVKDRTSTHRQQVMRDRYLKALEDANREIVDQALHDSLTGLPNRRYLDRKLSEAR
ncbi:MAG: hypothetical protein AAFX00_10865, partial [Pseudomonadota bacterium]